MVGRDVQGRASAASAASTGGGENSPSERTLFFASAGTAGVKLPSDKMLFLGGTRASRGGGRHAEWLRRTSACRVRK